MTNKISIDTNAGWQIYTNTVPDGSTPLGTVTTDYGTGALIVTRAGVYAQLNAGALKALPQRAVMDALGVLGGLNAAQRKSDERITKRAAGLEEVRAVYAYPADHAAIKDHAAYLTNKRKDHTVKSGLKEKT